jgi:formiminotetrahydrofolate cyclodeaminase
MLDRPLGEVLSAFAARTPTPGGGAAAAIAGALGASLCLMAVRFSVGRKGMEARHGDLSSAEQALSTALDRLLPMAEKDCAAYDAVSAAYKLPKGTEEEKAARGAQVQRGLFGAMAVPQELLGLIVEVLRHAATVADAINPNLASDLATGAELLRAGAEGAALNVRINAASIEDKAAAATFGKRADAVLERVRELSGKIRGEAEARIGRQ